MWKSKGWVRGLGFAICFVGFGMKAIPALEPFSQYVIEAGMVIQSGGWVNVGFNKLMGK